MYAVCSWRLSWYTSACTCWSTRDEINPRAVCTSSLGLETIPRSVETKPSGTVTTATTLPDRSSRWASRRPSRTRSTFSLTRSIVLLTSNRWPPTSTTGGSPSSSTSATRGFAFA